jgi:hypothetical protein
MDSFLFSHLTDRLISRGLARGDLNDSVILAEAVAPWNRQK